MVKWLAISRYLDSLVIHALKGLTIPRIAVLEGLAGVCVSGHHIEDGKTNSKRNSQVLQSLY